MLAITQNYEYLTPIAVALVGIIPAVLAIRARQKTQEVADIIGDTNGVGTVSEMSARGLAIASQVLTTQSEQAMRMAQIDERLRRIEEKLVNQ